jgi:hypothetical protein
MRKLSAQEDGGVWQRTDVAGVELYPAQCGVVYPLPQQRLAFLVVDLEVAGLCAH